MAMCFLEMISEIIAKKKIDVEWISSQKFD